MEGMKMLSAIGPIADMAISMNRPGRAGARDEFNADDIKISFVE